MATKKKQSLAKMAWPEQPDPLSSEEREAAKAAFHAAQRDIQAKRRTVDEDGAARLNARKPRSGETEGIRRDRLPTADDAAREVKRLVSGGMDKREAVAKVRDAVVKSREDVKARKSGKEG